MLKRDGILSTWHDKEITAGSNLDSAISTALEKCDVFIALVSPDYLASKYCYEREMERALERAGDGSMLLVPIILEPCDWQTSPLAKFKAVPKDGNPIALWTNENLAWLDVVSEVRNALSSSKAPDKKAATPLAATPSQLRVKIQRDFDVIDKSEFRDQAFETIRNFFKRSTDEVNTIELLKARFEEMSATAFTCTLVNRGKRNGESHITVHNSKGNRGEIIVVHSAHAESKNSYHGSYSVNADEYQMYLTGYMSTDHGNGRMSGQQVADYLWTDFLRRAGVELD
ncbi:toll/interleukin-1 receptor domain-containing protein [Terrihabitans soli]